MVDFHYLGYYMYFTQIDLSGVISIDGENVTGELTQREQPHRKFKILGLYGIVRGRTNISFLQVPENESDPSHLHFYSLSRRYEDGELGGLYDGKWFGIPFGGGEIAERFPENVREIIEDANSDRVRIKGNKAGLDLFREKKQNP